MAIFLLFVWGTAGAALCDDETVEPKRIGRDVFMRIKLRSSAKVLEGIVTRDFELVDSGAKDMKAMSEASNWPKADDKTYQHYGVEFRRLCQQMSEMAKAKNMEGVAFTHIQLTTSCIRCHDYVHGSLRKAPDKAGPFQLIPNARVGAKFKPDQ